MHKSLNHFINLHPFAIITIYKLYTSKVIEIHAHYIQTRDFATIINKTKLIYSEIKLNICVNEDLEYHTQTKRKQLIENQKCRFM